MFSGFQSNAFQNNAFQIGSVARATAVPTRPDKNEYSYHPQLAIKKSKAEEIENKLAIAVDKQQETSKYLESAQQANRQNKAIKQLMATQAMLGNEISELRIERARLMRMIDDEEAILALLLDWPLH